MGIIKRGILGGFSNKVANVVGTSWKGIAVIKSLPLSVANPRTAGQVTNRNEFKATSRFASAILASMIIPLMNRFAIQMSGFNLFMSINKNFINETGVITPASINFGTGKLGNTPLLTLTAAADTEDFSGTFSNVIDNTFKLSTDKVYLMIWNRTQDKVAFAGDTGSTRGGGNFSGVLSGGNNEGDVFDAYLVLIRADGTIVGNTGYLTGLFTAS